MRRPSSGCDLPWLRTVRLFRSEAFDEGRQHPVSCRAWDRRIKRASRDHTVTNDTCFAEPCGLAYRRAVLMFLNSWIRLRCGSDLGLLNSRWRKSFHGLRGMYDINSATESAGTSRDRQPARSGHLVRGTGTVDAH
ncbi:MAG: hypothetical protein DMF95_14310 [Acidobacteria bacterium]|nr:MAG: hypothetical protein DMF95_14310 [Acidobacteriota bacterium]